jgi:hypothetical protein
MSIVLPTDWTVLRCGPVPLRWSEIRALLCPKHLLQSVPQEWGAKAGLERWAHFGCKPIDCRVARQGLFAIPWGDPSGLGRRDAGTPD